MFMNKIFLALLVGIFFFGYQNTFAGSLPPIKRFENCTAEATTFRIEVLDFEYGIYQLYLSNKPAEPLITDEENPGIFYTENESIRISFTDYSEVDEDGYGVVKGSFHLKNDKREFDVECEVYGY